jgi:hypothetical protein
MHIIKLLVGQIIIELCFSPRWAPQGWRRRGWQWRRHLAEARAVVSAAKFFSHDPNFIFRLDSFAM